MSIIRVEIDTKSLYLNIKNDNEKGHTATVATPLKQGSSVRPELELLLNIPENINIYSKEKLVSNLLSKSRATAKINRVCVFDKIAVNGDVLKDLPSFCLYVREETDISNVHYGRQKLHYPMSLTYSDENADINNKAVIRAISEHLHNYAFLVEAFEYNTDDQILNFDIVVVGESEIPYSKIFINRRGVGNKFTPHFTESSDIYDSEIISLREKMGYDNVSPENFNEVISKNNELAQDIALEYLKEQGIESYRLFRGEVGCTWEYEASSINWRAFKLISLPR